MLRRAPVFTTIAALCLALGIGANAAVLSWTQGIVDHPFPLVRDQEQLVAVAGTAKGGVGYDEMSYPDFTDLAQNTSAFSAFFVSKITGATLTGGDRAERLVGQLVTANYFDALGVHPALGRGFVPGEDVGRGAHPVTVISYRLWQDRFGGKSSVIGTRINFDGVPHTVIGVTPPGFLGTFVGYAMQFWVPVSQQAVFDPSGYKLEDRSARWVEGFARMKSGVSLATAQVQIDGAARQLEAEYPNADRGRGVRILALQENPFDNAKDLKPMLRVASVVAALVLLIVCANIANLLLVRAIARHSELSVRRALGASGARVTRQLMTEGLVLATLGTAAGLIIAYLMRNVLGLFFAPRGGATLVFAADFNWRVLATTIGIGLASTLVLALAPAIHSARLDLTSAIRAAAPSNVGGSNRGRLRAALVIVQVCLSVVLLIGTGLVVTSLQRLLAADPGFAAANITMTSVDLYSAGYDTARAHRFQDDLLQRLGTIGGVSSVSMARSIPFTVRPFDNGPIMTDGYQPSKDEQPTADYNEISPDYFRTFGIPVIEGRDFNSADVDTSSRVAIVSRALAQRYWPNASPLGRRLQLSGTWMRVIGVVADIKYRSLTEAPGMLFYVPLPQRRPVSVSLFLRTSATGATRGVGPAIISAIHAIDPAVSPYEIITMREQVTRSTSSQRILVTLLALFSGVALLLAAMGLYGTISYMVSQNTRELGLRMALGARPSELLALVMVFGLRMTALGIVLGVAIALGTTRLLGALLYQVSPQDPLILASVCAIMGVAAVLACFVPAWRATRLDPVRALRA
jgi:predicted permease